MLPKVSSFSSSSHDGIFYKAILNYFKMQYV